jgi:hypothetical protein
MGAASASIRQTDSHDSRGLTIPTNANHHRIGITCDAITSRALYGSTGAANDIARTDQCAGQTPEPVGAEADVSAAASGIVLVVHAAPVIPLAVYEVTALA